MSRMGLDRERNKFRRTKKALMTLLVKRAEKHFKTNFRLQKFRDSPQKGKWKKLKRPRPDGSTTPILVDTGLLSNDIRAVAHSGRYGSVTFNADYASYHNQGNPDTNLVKRQFAGNSAILDDFSDKIILSYIQRKFRR